MIKGYISVLNQIFGKPTNTIPELRSLGIDI